MTLPTKSKYCDYCGNKGRLFQVPFLVTIRRKYIGRAGFNQTPYMSKLPVCMCKEHSENFSLNHKLYETSPTITVENQEILTGWDEIDARDNIKVNLYLPNGVFETKYTNGDRYIGSENHGTMFYNNGEVFYGQWYIVLLLFRLYGRVCVFRALERIHDWPYELGRASFL